MVTVPGRQLQAKKSAEVGIFVDLATAAKPLSSQLTYHQDDSTKSSRKRYTNWYTNYWSGNTVCCQPLSAQPLGYSTKYGNVIIESFSDRNIPPRSLADQEQIYQYGIDKYILTDPTIYITTSIYPRTLANQDLYCKDSSIKRDGIMEWFSDTTENPRLLANQNQIYQFSRDVWTDRIVYHTTSLGLSAFDPRGQVITLSASTLGDVTTVTAMTALCALNSITPTNWTGSNGSRGIHKQGNIIFTASEDDGIDTFTVDANGVTTHQANHVFSDGGTALVAYDVFADDDLVYLATHNEGLITYTYTAEGALTQKDKWKSTYYDGFSVWGDGTFIYSGGKSYDSNGTPRNALTSFSVNSTTGVITFKDNDDRGSGSGCGTYSWVQGNNAGHHVERVSDCYGLPEIYGGHSGSSGSTSYRGNNALDNQLYNYWLTYLSGYYSYHWMIIDLGSVKCVNGILVDGYSSYYDFHMELKYSSTNSSDPYQSWTGVFANWLVGGGWYRHDFSPISARYLYIRTRNNNSRYSIIREMQFSVATSTTEGYDSTKDIMGVWGDGSYVYAASRNDGLYTYSVDSNGQFTYKYSNEPDASSGTAEMEAVHGDDNFIYTVNRDGVQSYEADGNGQLTLKHNNKEIAAIDSSDQTYNVEAIPTKVPPDDNVITFVYVTTKLGGLFRFSVSSAGVLSLIDYDYTATGTAPFYGIGGDEDFIYTGGESSNGLNTFAVSAQTSYTTVTTGAAAVTRTIELYPWGEFTSNSSISASVNPVSGSWTVPFINPSYGTVDTTVSTMTGASAQILFPASLLTAVPSSSSTIGTAPYNVKYTQQVYGTVDTTVSTMTGASARIAFGQNAFAPISTTASTVTGALQKIYLNTSKGASTSDFWVGQTTTGSLPITSEEPTKIISKDIYFDVHYNKYATIRISADSTIISTEDLPVNYVVTANGYGIQGITTFKSEVSFTVRTENTIYTVHLKPFFYVIR